MKKQSFQVHDVKVGGCLFYTAFSLKEANVVCHMIRDNGWLNSLSSSSRYVRRQS
jgi:hypothetical protein